MHTLHTYIFKLFIKNLFLALVALIGLFLVIDFFDRVDHIIENEVPFSIALQYFLYKIPLTLSLMLPIAVLISTLFTIGILSKNSEITAMRASGLTISWIGRPIFVSTILFSMLSLIMNETFVPHAQRRVREIYNIDIRRRDETGSYSQNDFWWRSGNKFQSVNIFDSRTNTLHEFSRFEITPEFKVRERMLAHEVQYLNPALGWNMQGVVEYQFRPNQPPAANHRSTIPLLIPETPKDFYRAETDPDTMSYGQLKEFIAEQQANGLSITSYLADLYAKIAFPFVIFIVALVSLPFAMLPARTGSLAASFVAGALIGFSYYAVHSFSLALGRAEFWPPMLSAWMATLVLGAIGAILVMGAESPS